MHCTTYHLLLKSSPVWVAGKEVWWHPNLLLLLYRSHITADLGVLSSCGESSDHSFHLVGMRQSYLGAMESGLIINTFGCIVSEVDAAAGAELLSPFSTGISLCFVYLPASSGNLFFCAIC